VAPIAKHWRNGGAHLSGVDVVVIALIGSANGHYYLVLAIVKTKVVHRWGEDVLILCEPLGEVDGWGKWHGGDEW